MPRQESLEDDVEALRLRSLHQFWALNFLSAAFRDLAAAYGRSDGAAAMQMLRTINADIARQLVDQDAELVARGLPKGSMREIAQEVHKALMRAEQAVRDAMKPQ